MTEQQAQTIRRRLALYRRFLSEGVNAETARQYLIEIKRLEVELAALERDPTA